MVRFFGGVIGKAVITYRDKVNLIEKHNKFILCAVDKGASDFKNFYRNVKLSCFFIKWPLSM